MKIMSWNVHHADETSAAWAYLLEIEPEVALLQEVRGFPDTVRERFNVLARPAGKKDGGPQKFCTAVITKFKISGELDLRSDRPWVNEQAPSFAGNLVAATLTDFNQEAIHVVSVHSPHWAIAKEKWEHTDVTGLKLAANPDVWCTEILWDLVRCTMPIVGGQWVVGGDFNSSEKFDFGPKGDRGNREIMARMNGLGLKEVLRWRNQAAVPTFKQPRGGKTGHFIHQLDHLYVSPTLCDRLVDCRTGDQERVFQQRMSDHLPVIADFKDAAATTEPQRRI